MMEFIAGFFLCLTLVIVIAWGIWRMMKRLEVPMTEGEQATVRAVRDWSLERRGARV